MSNTATDSTKLYYDRSPPKYSGLYCVKDGRELKKETDEEITKGKSPLYCYSCDQEYDLKGRTWTEPKISFFNSDKWLGTKEYRTGKKGGWTYYRRDRIESGIKDLGEMFVVFIVVEIIIGLFLGLSLDAGWIWIPAILLFVLILWTLWFTAIVITELTDPIKLVGLKYWLQYYSVVLIVIGAITGVVFVIGKWLIPLLEV